MSRFSLCSEFPNWAAHWYVSAQTENYALSSEDSFLGLSKLYFPPSQFIIAGIVSNLLFKYPALLSVSKTQHKSENTATDGECDNWFKEHCVFVVLFFTGVPHSKRWLHYRGLSCSSSDKRRPGQVGSTKWRASEGMTHYKYDKTMSCFFIFL